MIAARKLALIALLALLASGCGSNFRLKAHVDSIARADASEKKVYTLLSGDEKIGLGDLQFQEYAAYIDKLLQERGFVKAQSPEAADIAIFVTYMIGDPQERQYSYSIPVWGKTGISSATAYGTVSAYGNTANYAGTTTYTPSYGVVGSNSYAGTFTVYSRALVLDAYDLAAFRASKAMNQVWRTTAVSTGQSPDLRAVMPYLVSSVRPYVGVSTGRQVEVILREKDPYVAELRALLAPSEPAGAR